MHFLTDVNDENKPYNKYCPFCEMYTTHTDEWQLLNEETSEEILVPFCHECERFDPMYFG